jgi:caa(3)-type oxidase subunit IV
MTTESHVHHPNYVKIWAILVALLIASVIGSMSGIRWVVIIAAFGIAFVKAGIVAKNFMHITVEKRWVPYLLITCLVFMVILFAAVSPDILKHSGRNWENNAAKQAVETRLQAAPQKHE